MLALTGSGAGERDPMETKHSLRDETEAGLTTSLDGPIRRLVVAAINQLGHC